MYQNIKKWTNAFKINIISLIVLSITLVLNILTINNKAITNIVGISTFILMFTSMFVIFKINHSHDKDIKAGANILDNELKLKSNGLIRCEAESDEKLLPDRNNILLNNQIVQYDYHIYYTSYSGENIVDFFQNIRIYKIKLYDGKRQFDYGLQMGHCIRFYKSTYLNQDIVIKSDNCNFLRDTEYTRNNYEQVCKLSNSIVYKQKGSVLPNADQLEQDYNKILNIINRYFNVDSFLIIIKLGEVQIYLRDSSNAPVNVLTDKSDRGLLNIDDLNTFIEMLQQFL